jgi:hypothetical protein
MSTIAFDVVAKKKELFELFKQEFEKSIKEGDEALETFMTSMAFLIRSRIPVVAEQEAIIPLFEQLMASVLSGMSVSIKALDKNNSLSKIVKAH